MTGSSRGIGRAIADRFATEGAALVLNGRDESALGEAEAELRDAGASVVSVVGSIADDDVAERITATAAETYGRIDVVVNNAAMTPRPRPLLEEDLERVMRTFLINTWAPVRLVQRAVAHGLGAGDAASVVNLSSVTARHVYPLNSVYTASKAALEVFTRTLARDCGPRGIRVNALAPGAVRTELSRGFWESERGDAEARILPLQRLGDVEDIAGAVAFLASEDARWITGIVLDVDGGRLIVGGEPLHQMGQFGKDLVP